VLAKAEVRQLAGFGRAADDDVILKEEAHRLGGLPEPTREAAVGIAGCGIAAGMVVDEDEGVGVVSERLLEDVTRSGGALVEAAAEDFLRTEERQFRGEQQEPHRFIA